MNAAENAAAHELLKLIKETARQQPDKSRQYADAYLALLKAVDLRVKIESGKTWS